MWANPAFAQAFIGSYVPLEGLEPEFNNEEKIVIRDQLLPILQGNNAMAAIPVLEELAKRPTATAGIDFLIGNIYLQNARTAQAEQAYLRAITKFRNYRRAWKNLAMIYITTDRADKAIEPISKTIELGEVSGQLYGMLGFAYMNQENYIAAETAFRNALLMEPREKNWKLNLFQSMMLQERFNESNALLRTLISEEPNNADYWKYQANVYIGLERPMAAAEVLEIRDRMGRSEAPSLEMLGAIYFNNQLYDVAFDVYKRALALGGTRFETLYNSTNALAAVGRYEEAMELVKRLRERFAREIADDKDKRLNLLVLEASCLRALDEVDRAATILNEIVVEDPMNGRALIELGLYYRGLEVPDYQRAITMFERAANIPEFAAQANVQHGQLLVRMQRYRDAVRVLRRAQEISYSDNVQDFLVRVERVARQN
jgi:tetratricopeptide (TPR) repeat protein